MTGMVMRATQGSLAMWLSPRVLHYLLQLGGTAMVEEQQLGFDPWVEKPCPGFGVDHHLIGTSVGIDWYCATQPLDTACAAAAAQVMIETLTELEQAGNRRRDTSLLGFQGSMVGGSFVGIRGDLLLCQLTGERASDNWVLVHSRAAHVSRLDLQVTTLWDVMPTHLGESVRAQARYHNARRASAGRRRLSWREGDEGEFTFYLGSALSQQAGVMYEKTRESKGLYPNAWRYEIRTRNNIATLLANYLATHADHNRVISAWCGRWWKERGIIVPWQIEGVEVPSVKLPSEPSDAARSMKWLRTQVAPTVRWLLQHYERAIIEEALMLSAGPLGPFPTDDLEVDDAE
jgi:hypothetical protein